MTSISKPNETSTSNSLFHHLFITLAEFGSNKHRSVTTYSENYKYFNNKGYGK